MLGHIWKEVGCEIDFLKDRSEVNRIKNIKKRNYCVSLLRKTKKQYYANLTDKDVANETVKPCIFDKVRSNEKKAVAGDEKTFTQVAEELNSFFSNVVKNLQITEYSETNP